MFWFILLFAAISFLSFLLYFAVKYRNNFKLCFLFGKKGCGKSTTLMRIARTYIRRGWTVYSTEALPGCYKIDPGDIGFYKLSRKSVLIVDEIGLIWHAREWKNFKKEVREFFKLQRHWGVRCYVASQTFDVDKGIRDLCDEMYLLTNVLNCFSYAKRIVKSFDCVAASADSPSAIVENLRFDSFFFFLFGSRRLTFIPKYAKYFDSFAVPELPDKEFSFVPVQDPKLYRFLYRKKMPSQRIQRKKFCLLSSLKSRKRGRGQ